MLKLRQMLPARLQESQPTVHLRHWPQSTPSANVREMRRCQCQIYRFNRSVPHVRIRRERAVELAYEGHRFTDLRRWLLIDKKPYTEKTAVDFQRVGDLAENPQETAVSGYTYRVIVTRNFTEKHYWLPLKLSDVTLYPEFYQNPGW